MVLSMFLHSTDIYHTAVYMSVVLSSLTPWTEKPKVFPVVTYCVVYPPLEQRALKNFEAWSIIVLLNCQSVVKPFSANAAIKSHAMVLWIGPFHMRALW